MNDAANGNTGKTGKTEKLDLRCDEDLISDLEEMRKLSGQPVAELVRRAIKRYVASEKPKLLARLKRQLLSTNHRN